MRYDLLTPRTSIASGASPAAPPAGAARSPAPVLSCSPAPICGGGVRGGGAACVADDSVASSSAIAAPGSLVCVISNDIAERPFTLGEERVTEQRDDRRR